MLDRRRLLIANSQQGDNLPEGYKRVEYLESTGTQRINIPNIIINKDKKLIADIGVLQKGTNIMFTLSSTMYGFQVPSSTTEINLEGIWCGGHACRTVLSTELRTMLHCEISKNGLYVNNVFIGNTAESDEQIKGFTLFCYYSNYSFYYGNVMLGRVTLLNANGKKELNLLSCIDNNNRPCMYDTVSGQTFYNAGSGEFLYGNVR